MSKEVWKFDLHPGLQEIGMPQGARLLYAVEQYETGVLYALVDPAGPYEPRAVFVVPSGEPFEADAGLVPLGVLKLHGGALMYHVFGK